VTGEAASRKNEKPSFPEVVYNPRMTEFPEQDIRFDDNAGTPAAKVGMNP